MFCISGTELMPHADGAHAEHLVELCGKAGGELLAEHRSQNAAQRHCQHIDDHTDHFSFLLLIHKHKKAAEPDFPRSAALLILY